MNIILTALKDFIREGYYFSYLLDLQNMDKTG